MEFFMNVLESIQGLFKHEVTQKLVVVLFLFLLTRIVVRIMSDAIERVSQEKRIDANKRTIFALITKILQYGIYIIAVGIGLEAIGLSITPFLAIGSAVGVAVGLGAQQVVKDIIAGFMILTQNQFQVGDVVEIEECTGKVEEISLVTTFIRNQVTGEVDMIPNGLIKIVTNYSKEYMFANVELPIPYDEEIETVLRKVEDIVKDVKLDDALGPIVVSGVTSYRETGMVVRVNVKMKAGSNWAAEITLRNLLKTELEKDGISIQAMHTVNMKNPKSV